MVYMNTLDFCSFCECTLMCLGHLLIANFPLFNYTAFYKLSLIFCRLHMMHSDPTHLPDPLRICSLLLQPSCQNTTKFKRKK